MDVINIFAIIWITLCILSALIMVVDVVSGHLQQMAIMNVVYPLTALYAGPLALVVYFTIGREKSGMGHSHHNNQKPMWQKVILGTLHCGAGCTLGDIVAETFLIFVSVKIAGSDLAAKWVFDFILAFLFGILFQYFAIKPMKHLPPGKTLLEAVKADSLSLTSWQLGMYGFMALAIFVIFKHPLPATSIIFWFAMQVAMFFGFITAYPVNWWLLKKGIKMM